MALGYGRVGTNQFACSKFIVDANGLDKGATHVTLTAALGDATSGDTIFVKPSLPAFAAYDEDITLKPGVNIVGFNGNGFSGVQAIIKGKITLGTATDCSVKDIQIRTDSDYCIEDTGSTSGSNRFVNCSIRIDSTGGLNLNNVNRTLTFNNCQFGRATNSLKDFNVTTCVALSYEYCTFSGASTTAVASTIAAGTLGMCFCTMNRHAIALSGTATGFFESVHIAAVAENLICIDFDSSSSTSLIKKLTVSSGTAAGINIGASATVTGSGIDVRSSNGEAISGTGTLIGPGAEFFGQSPVISTGLTWSSGATTSRQLELRKVATANSQNILKITADAAGFGDVKAVNVDYISGAVAAGENEEAILVNIDESASTGGSVSGYRVIATAEGSATINGYETGINVNPVVHESGTFGDADNILNKAVDVTAALASGGAGAISIFVLDNETFTVGDAATWDEFEIILSTGASGSGVAPTFEYSTGGAGYSAFIPSDGTNGFRNTGAILWDSANLAGWATATSGNFEIRITRTRNSLSTTPIIDELQISSTTEYKWDKDGAVNLNSLTLATDLAVAEGGTGASTLTGVLTGNGASAVTANAVTQHGVLFGGASNAVASTAVGTATNVLTSNGPGVDPTFQVLGARTAFTPVLEGSTGNPTPTYSFQAGFYQRIGAAVFITINLRITNITGGTGNLRIGDLPFASANVSNAISLINFGVNDLSGVGAGGKFDSLVCLMDPNNDYLHVQEVTPEGTYANVQVSDVPAATTITFELAGWYWVA